MNIKCLFKHKHGIYKNVREPENSGMWMVSALKELYSDSQGGKKLIYETHCLRCGIMMQKSYLVPSFINDFYYKKAKDQEDKAREYLKIEYSKKVKKNK